MSAGPAVIEEAKILVLVVVKAPTRLADGADRRNSERARRERLQGLGAFLPNFVDRVPDLAGHFQVHRIVENPAILKEMKEAADDLGVGRARAAFMPLDDGSRDREPDAHAVRLGRGEGQDSWSALSREIPQRNPDDMLESIRVNWGCASSPPENREAYAQQVRRMVSQLLLEQALRASSVRRLSDAASENAGFAGPAIESPPWPSQ